MLGENKKDRSYDLEQVFNKQELEDLNYMFNPKLEKNKLAIPDDKIDQIVELANKKFNEITGNTDPSKDIYFYYDYNDEKDVYKFSNLNTRLSIDVQLSEDSKVCERLLCKINDIVIAPDGNGNLRMKDLYESAKTYKRAVGGDVYDTIHMFN